MRETQAIAFALLRYALCGTEIPPTVRESITERRLETAYQILKMHDLAHLGYDGLLYLGDLGLSETEVYQQFKRQQQLAVYRHEQKVYEYDQICAAFEETQIPYLPLKGAVMKGYYPQEWMRTSCDIDILVPADKIGSAVETLKRKLHYRLEAQYSHDVSLFAENGVHLELHYDLIEDYLPPISVAVLSAYWNTASPVQEGACRHVASDEMFYFYHIAHMAKHFENGGCGIRSFMDLWLLHHKVEFDQAAREKMLQKGRLSVFEKVALRLANVWFSNEKHDDLTERVQEYVLSGGVYGSMENRMAMENSRYRKGKFRYVMRRIFLPYKHLKWVYPILQKHKWLTPFYEVRRWGRLIFKGRLKSSMREMQAVSALEQAKKRDIAQLLRDLGLEKK